MPDPWYSYNTLTDVLHKNQDQKSASPPVLGGNWCLTPAKKYKLYKSSINKSLHFVQGKVHLVPEVYGSRLLVLNCKRKMNRILPKNRNLSNGFERKMWHITNVLQIIDYKNGRYITSQGELLKSSSLN